MKKILLLFASVGLLSLASCNNDDDFVGTDTDTIAPVIQTPPLDFNAAGQYSNFVTFGGTTYEYDSVLIYRRIGFDNATNKPLWEIIPRSYNFDNGDFLGYDYNFTKDDAEIFMYGNFPLEEEPQYSQDQVFRIVLVPGFNANAKSAVNTKDYYAVIKAYGYSENNVKILQ